MLAADQCLEKIDFGFAEIAKKSNYYSEREGQ